MWGHLVRHRFLQIITLKKVCQQRTANMPLYIYKRRPIIFIMNNLPMRKTKSFQDIKPPRKQKSDKQEPV